MPASYRTIGSCHTSRHCNSPSPAWKTPWTCNASLKLEPTGIRIRYCFFSSLFWEDISRGVEAWWLPLCLELCMCMYSSTRLYETFRTGHKVESIKYVELLSSGCRDLRMVDSFDSPLPWHLRCFRWSCCCCAWCRSSWNQDLALQLDYRCHVACESLKNLAEYLAGRSL